MFKVLIDGEKVWEGESEKYAYDLHTRFCDETKSINSEIFTCRVSLYKDNFCIRELPSAKQEEYNLPFTD
jgi:hypothetical protein